MYDIDSKTYAVLYFKYLQRNRTKQMVDLAGDLKGKRVVDLCAGGCRLSKEVLKRKPKTIVAVDESLRMLQPIVLYNVPGDSPINKICISAEEALTCLTPGGTDAMFCQQGVNYWFQPEHAKLIKKVLAPNGVFIFNTFSQEPSKLPYIKNYLYHGRDYVEISWLVKDMVKHVQIVSGMDPHFTEFRWIPPKEFKDAFKAARFKTEIHSSGNTDIYVCRR